MKSRNAFLSLLLATGGAFLLPATHAGSPAAKAMAYPVSNVTLPNTTSITIGTGERFVQHNIRRPLCWLGDGTAAYSGFSADREEPNRDGCDVLLVTFAAGRVSDMKLINSRALRVLDKHVKKGASNLESAFRPLAPAPFDMPAAPESASVD